MNRDALIAYTANVVLEQGGDDEAIFAVLRDELPGSEPIVEDNDLCQAFTFAACALYVLDEFGMEALREIRDRRRVVAAKPARTSGLWGWRRTG